MNNKTKRILSMAAIGVACVAMGALVVNHAGADAHPDTDPSSTVESEIVVLEPTPILPPSSSSQSVNSAFVPSSGASASAPLTTISKPASKPAKPAPPASSALTNKDKKPSHPKAGTETNAKRTGDTSPKQPVGKTTKGNKHAASQTGKIYVPGFGWQKPTGGKAIKMPDAGGDINKQVGTMD
mgnify:CR=1 FL=1